MAFSAMSNFNSSLFFYFQTLIWLPNQNHIKRVENVKMSQKLEMIGKCAKIVLINCSVKTRKKQAKIAACT